MSSFDEGAVVPGEEELMVPLNPPIINPPEKTFEFEQQEENQNLGKYTNTAIAIVNITSTFTRISAVNGKETTENGEVVEKTEESKLSEGEDEDDEDDNINVVIGDIRTTPSYNSNLHIKRGNLLTLTKVSVFSTWSNYLTIFFPPT